MRHPQIPFQLSAFVIVAIYAVVAGLWILFSDRIVGAFFTDPARLVAASMMKGWLFVAVTAGLLYWLMRRMSGAEARARQAAEAQLAETEAARAEAEASRDVAQQTGLALMASETRFQLALDASNDGLWDWDYRSGDTFLSLRFCEICGLTPGVDRGFEFLQEIVLPEDWPGLARAIESGLRGETPYGEADFRIRTGAGDLRWVHGKGRVVERDAAGEPLRLIGTVSDITARKNAEENLRKVSLAVEQSPASVEITDLNACIEYVNPAFLASTGYTREELIGTNPRLLRSGKTPPERYAQMWAALVRGETWKGEFVNRRKDGSEYSEFAIISPLRMMGGAVTHYVAVKEDITERKRLGAELDHHRQHLEETVARRTEELHVARAQADAANAAKSEFLSHMSHEIRTPLNAIVGLARLLRANDDRRAERLDQLEQASRHLLGIVNDVLDLSKIEAGHLELETLDFHLPTLLEAVAALVRADALAKGLTVTVDAGDVPQWLRGDPTRLRQALLNFAANAVKFAEHGGVSLRARRLERAGGAPLARFEVVDSGPGIAPEVAGRLFRAFEQGDVAVRRRHGGTGLGLVITQNLARMMGGDAGVVSQPGRGSTFWFTACLAEGRPATGARVLDAEACAEATLRARRISGRVLLVDDDALNRAIGAETLASFGLDVDVAEDGTAALHQVRTTLYDLVLMDLQMPVMDGLSATRAIRQLEEGARLPVVAMTANAFAEDRRACLEAGMDDVLVKPVDSGVMSATLLKWIGRRHEAAPSRQG